MVYRSKEKNETSIWPTSVGKVQSPEKYKMDVISSSTRLVPWLD